MEMGAIYPSGGASDNQIEAEDAALNGLDLSISLRIGEDFAPRQPIDFWYSMLRELPLHIGLTPLDPPMIHEFPSAQVGTELGVTGVLVMVQSHIAFHWWPEIRFLHLTISSCKQFNVETAVIFLRGIFPVQWAKFGESRWK